MKFWNIATDDAFQFTPLREGRRAFGRCATACIIFQFTPLREGRHERTADGRILAAISIHAPPRGATGGWMRPNEVRERISIHAPPRGATYGGGKSIMFTLFQFTPLREGRRDGDG